MNSRTRLPLPEPVQRLMRFAGKKRSEVSNPCLTAREAIIIADWMHDYATADNALRETLQFIAGHDLNGADDRVRAIICGLFIINAKKALKASHD